MLRWPKHHSNTAALPAVDVPTIRFRTLIVKLRFLQRVMKSDHCSLSGQMVLACSDDVNCLCVVKECRELEEHFGTHFTSDILEGSDLSFKCLKKTILECDRKQLVAKCLTKAPTIAKVATRGGWSRIWDTALDLGEKSVRGVQHLSRVMSHHGRGDKPCPLCDTASLQTSLLQHLLDHHSKDLHLDRGLCSDNISDWPSSLHLHILCNFYKLYTY